VVIVDPHQVAVLDVFGNFTGKETIRFLVGIPGRFVKSDLSWVVMKERPKDLV
jgi:hypothetical protein